MPCVRMKRLQDTVGFKDQVGDPGYCLSDGMNKTGIENEANGYRWYGMRRAAQGTDRLKVRTGRLSILDMQGQGG